MTAFAKALSRVTGIDVDVESLKAVVASSCAVYSFRCFLSSTDLICCLDSSHMKTHRF